MNLIHQAQGQLLPAFISCPLKKLKKVANRKSIRPKISLWGLFNG
jgi:hypothetical protein